MSRQYSHIILNILIRRFFCGFLLFGVFAHIQTAVAQNAAAIDSIQVKKGSYFLINDEIIKIDKDTTFVFVDSLKYTIGNSDDEEFFNNLKDAAAKRKWSQKLYDFLIIEPGSEVSSPQRNNLFIASRRINRHRGKEITNILFKQLDLFGPSLDDTSREATLIFERIGNKIHTTTREKVIRNNLFMDEGDVLNIERIQDAERILRELPFIKDARILPIDSLSSGDSVGLMVMTQDVFPYSLDGNFHGLKGGRLEVTYHNFLGLGHQVRNEVSYDKVLPKQRFGYGAMYRIPNIRRSFISAEANYFRHYNHRLTNVAVGRDFISPQIVYAGGIDLGQKFTRQRFLIQGTDEIDTLTATHNYQNLWFGRSFRINIGSEEFRDRSRLILSARMLREHYIDRPEVAENHNQEFQHAQLMMGSVTFSTRHYFRDRLVYSYGRTEDIPYGQKVTFSGGYERNEFSNRRLMSLDLSMARFFSGIGYVYAQLLMESYFRNGKSEQGIIRPTVSYISDLNKWGRFRTRNFVTLEFTRGINRFDNEFITINRDDGIRGFNSHFVMGNQRLNLQYELVAFSPADIVGFRIAPYFFYDAAWLAQRNDAIYKGDFYQGFGLGIRLRNDNLTFNTLEVRLGYYPNSPGDVSNLGFNISQQSRTRFKDFNVTAPDVTPFR